MKLSRVVAHFQALLDAHGDVEAIIYVTGTYTTTPYPWKPPDGHAERLRGLNYPLGFREEHEGTPVVVMGRYEQSRD